MVKAPCIRILIVDDHTLFRQGLRKVLEEFDDVEVIAEASNGKEAIGRVDETSPDVVLMDIKMPHMDGVEAIGLIRQRHPDLPIIAVSMHEDAEYVMKAVNAGASGYVQKNICADRLLETIRQVHGGDGPPVHLAVDVKTLQKVLPAVSNAREDTGLTEQETRILKCMADGKANKQIAADLRITGQTVKSHVSSIFRKMGVSDRTQAVAEALRHGLVT